MNFVRLIRVFTVALMLVSVVIIVSLNDMTTLSARPDLTVKLFYQDLDPFMGAFYWNSPI